MFKIADVVLLIKQDDALLVLNFVHASVGEGAEVISKQDRVSKNAGSAFVAVFKRLDIGDHQNSKQSFLNGVFCLVNQYNQLF